MDSIKVLAIDPGNNTGLSYSVNGKIIYALGINSPSVFDMHLSVGSVPEGTVVAVEEQFAKGLIEKSTRWSATAELRNLQVELVYAQTWQSFWGITRARASKKKGAIGEKKTEHKKRIIELARKESGLQDITSDSADSIMLNLYVYNLIKMRKDPKWGIQSEQ